VFDAVVDSHGNFSFLDKDFDDDAFSYLESLKHEPQAVVTTSVPIHVQLPIVVRSALSPSIVEQQLRLNLG
jgi:hypothetical protein